MGDMADELIDMILEDYEGEEEEPTSCNFCGKSIYFDAKNKPRSWRTDEPHLCRSIAKASEFPLL